MDRVLVALCLLLPGLAGCTWLDKPTHGDGLREEVVREAYYLPDLRLGIDNSYGNVRVAGPAFAIPLRFDGEEGGAVYLDGNVSWRADAMFHAREGSPMRGDLFVQAPAGTWGALRAAQSWIPVNETFLAVHGYPSNIDLFRRANGLFPANVTSAQPNRWIFNGTVAGQSDSDAFSLAVESGPFVFRRTSTNVIAIDKGLIFSYDDVNMSLTVSSDGIAQARILDDFQARFDVRWETSQVDVTITTPPFRETDLSVEDDKMARIIRVQLPGVAEVSMVKYQSRTLTDGLVEIRGANTTLVMRS